MKDCVDEGMLQSYFDGELSAKMMEQVASHLASCRACTDAVSELEGESWLLASAFEPELALSVPTERLRERLDTAIAASPRRAHVMDAAPMAPVVRGWLQSIVDLFTLSPQRAFGYAGLVAVVLFAIVLGLVQLKRTPANKSPEVASNGRLPAPVTTPVAGSSTGAIAKESPLPEPVNSKPGFTPAVYHPNKNTQPHSVAKDESAHVKLLPGERSYLKTIAALDTTIKAESSRPMRPALQSEYERNLAMVDRAIAATRSAAKSNPNDPDAAEFMFAAYQTKVDFLNQVADARLGNRQH